ncbi:hypothetical protein HPB50_008400 [Hyalomma asiaticum]|uniref:Uncharacterized protein n=1 Tax=Hyalomma asiaticum TaxID=266040 RepID=A0ACB7RN24_HYAAI|nr:hypothetical protein HPB50_008400 [Hyalomma asiaticum]
MAGMAWTLHPALFYEKYGTVLVQLWESGAIGTLFHPVRRLSKSISDRITSLRHHHGAAATAALEPGTAVVAKEALSLMDDYSVATEDEATSKANREPGDTSPEPSTSQQNELAFQGDIYTQMRRSRRQRERLQRIRETREKFLESGSSSSGGSELGRKRRGFQRRGSSILGFKKGKGLRKAAGVGTPLTDMEGVAPARAVVIDVSGSPATGGSSISEDEDTAVKVGGPKRDGTIQADELVEENDSLQTFRDIRGASKRSHGSPPPAVREPSESQTDTSSVASTSAVAQAPVGSKPPLKKLAEPFATAKAPSHSALRKPKGSSRRASVALRGKLETAPEVPLSAAAIGTSSKVVPGMQADFSSATSLLSTKEYVASGKLPEAPSKVKIVEKKDASKRRKPKVEKQRKKKANGKSKTPRGGRKTSRALSVDSRVTAVTDSGAVSESPRKLEGAAVHSRDSVRSQVPGRDVTSTSASTSTVVTPSHVAEATRNKEGTRVDSPTATSVRPPGQGSKLKPVKTTPAAAGPAMVHSKLPSTMRVKEDGTLKTSTVPPMALEKRTARERGEEPGRRVEGPEPSVPTPVEVASSRDALGTSAAASQRASAVHRRHAKKKHRTSMSPAAAAVETTSGAPRASTKDVELEGPNAPSPDSAERVFDEAAAVHDHHHHHRRRHSKPKKHVKEGSGKRHSRKTKEDRPVVAATAATGSELPPTTTAGVQAEGGHSGVQGSDVATTALKESGAVYAQSQPGYSLPPTADVTLTGTDTIFSLGGQRHPPRTSTVVRGDDVTVHVDLTSRDRATMFWPFGRRGHKKRETKRP